MDFTIFIVAMLAIYFAPTLVAWGKPQVGSVFLLNLFLGWSLIGWVVALIWALPGERARPRDAIERYPHHPYPHDRYGPRDDRWR
jgi:hypothetical protein